MGTDFDLTKIKDLCSYIAEQEDKVSHVKIGDIREIVGILSDLLVTDASCDVVTALIRNGKKRQK